MELQTAKGVRDIPPEEKIVQNQIVDTLRNVFETYGFAPLETPILERYETLAAKGGAGTSSDVFNETFKLKDQGERDLGLRFELTTSLARFVGMNSQLKMPFKRYEMGPVFRDGPIKLGRYRQFWQCDIDIIGSKSMLADAEVLAIIDTVFNKLELDVIIKVNNRKLLNGILEQAGIKKKEDAIVAIDKLDKIGKKGVEQELLERGYKKEQIVKLFEIIKADVSITELKQKIITNEGKEGLEEIDQLFNYLKNMDVSSAIFDVSLARGLGYYTGTVFEAFLKKGKVTSSLAGGGRWDNMIGKFLGDSREIPAVGVAFGLAPIMDVLKETNNFTKRTLAEVYIVPIKTVNESLKITQKLREAGINTEIDLNEKGMSKNMQYANSLGIPYVIIIGEDEIKQKKVLLRNMVSGDQQLLTLAEVIKVLKK
ncbi:histidine--tRNA ligase [Candidatus Woesearchaeota archaeon CG_4_10_14_0_2_um_filter_33_13]|nr:MAG: histidine--tRNA ligase [Candidatus Woesearchaeota archaeon CG_4_10_14_0_2_um_filter_33_13]